MKLKKSLTVLNILMKNSIPYMVAAEWLEVSQGDLAVLKMHDFDRLMVREYKPSQAKVRNWSREYKRRREKKEPKQKAKKVVQKVVKEPKQKVRESKPIPEPWKSSKRCVLQQFREVMGNIEIQFVPFELVQKQVAKANKVRKVRGSYKKKPKTVKKEKRGFFTHKEMAEYNEQRMPIQRPPAVYSNPNWSAMYQ